MEKEISDLLDFEKKIDNSSRILIVNPLHTHWSYQLTTEIALRSRKITRNVRWIQAGAQVSKKYEINKSDLIPSFLTKGVIDKIKINFEKYDIEYDVNLIDLNSRHLTEFYFENIEKMRSLEISELPIGKMIYSAISSVLHSTDFDISDARKFTNMFMEWTLQAKIKIEENIQQFKPTSIYTINDRLIASSLAQQISDIKKIDKRIFYWGSTPNKIVEYKNSLYDSNEWRKQIQDKWLTRPPDRKEIELLKSEIDKLSDTISEDSLKFQPKKKVIMNLNSYNRTCVFYATSEHEHSPQLVHRTNGRFSTQYQAFESLQNVCKRNGYKLILKHHPVQQKIISFRRSKPGLRDWKKISINNDVLQIPPESNIDTYDLINSADFTVTWGSTVGLESVLRGRPTIFLSDVHYLDLGWGIHSWNELDLENKIINGVPIVSTTELMPWYWFIKDYGTSTKYSKFINNQYFIDGMNLNKVSKFQKFFRSFYWIYNKIINLINY